MTLCLFPPSVVIGVRVRVWKAVVTNISQADASLSVTAVTVKSIELCSEVSSNVYDMKLPKVAGDMS